MRLTSVGWLVMGFVLAGGMGFFPKAAQSAGCPSSTIAQVRSHRVARGETVEGLARRYGISLETMRNLNPGLGRGAIPVGKQVLIAPSNGIVVNVPRGQTFRDVARSYNVRPDVVFELNGCQKDPRTVFIPRGLSARTNSTPTATTTPVVVGLRSPLPVASEILIPFGWQKNANTGEAFFHSGLDLAVPPDTSVLAAGDGTVAFAAERGEYGNLVVINHAGGKQTRYAHLGAIRVTVGQKIKQGESIGTVGSSGKPDTPQPHLHFEVRYSSASGWVAEDPTPYLSLVSGKQN